MTRTFDGFRQLGRLPAGGSNILTIEQLDTPALLLDLDAVERNLDRMAAEFAGKRAQLRPHAKTHKTAILAQMQMERGAIGVCCAKLGEAEALCEGGIREMLITTELVGATKIERLMTLAARVNVTVVVDSAAVTEPLARAASRLGIRLRVLVDVNVGQDRAGTKPGEPAVALGRFVASCPSLELAGLQGYEGHLQHVADARTRGAADASAVALLCETARGFSAAGLSTEIVTTGGTGTYRFAVQHDAVTDVQPGSYVVMDAQYGAIDGLDFEHALTLSSTVISVRDDVAILDAGYKSLSNDGGLPRLVTGNAEFEFAGDEFGKLTGARELNLRVGDVVRVVPGHCDTTINLHDAYIVHRGATIIDRWPILARGASR
jgi:D-serine deaminase-like pyridoxal phosphate-dependent protein